MARSATDVPRTSAVRTPAQWFALAAGAAYLIVGIWGFFATGFDNWVGVDPARVIVFSVNPSHNLVHIALGLIWLGASRTHRAARSTNTAIGVVYLVIAVLGLIPAELLRFLAVNTPDNFLHLATGLVSLYFGTKGAGRLVPTNTSTAGGS